MPTSNAVQELLKDTQKTEGRYRDYLKIITTSDKKERALTEMECLLSSYIDLVGGALMNKHLPEADKIELVSALKTTAQSLCAMIDMPSKTKDQDESAEKQLANAQANEKEKAKINLYCQNAISLLSAKSNKDNKVEYNKIEKGGEIVKKKLSGIPDPIPGPNSKDLKKLQTEALNLKTTFLSHVKRINQISKSYQKPLSKRIASAVEKSPDKIMKHIAGLTKGFSSAIAAKEKPSNQKTQP